MTATIFSRQRSEARNGASCIKEVSFVMLELRCESMLLRIAQLDGVEESDGIERIHDRLREEHNAETCRHKPRIGGLHHALSNNHQAKGDAGAQTALAKRHTRRR